MVFSALTEYSILYASLCWKQQNADFSNHNYFIRVTMILGQKAGSTRNGEQERNQGS